MILPKHKIRVIVEEKGGNILENTFEGRGSAFVDASRWLLNLLFRRQNRTR